MFSVDNLGAMAYRGDLIACEVDFRGVPKEKVSVLFFLNGIKIARSSVKYTEGNKLFPFVSLGFEGITVLTKVCSSLCNFNVCEHLQTIQPFTKRLCSDCFKARTGKERVDLI